MSEYAPWFIASGSIATALAAWVGFIYAVCKKPWQSEHIGKTRIDYAFSLIEQFELSISVLQRVRSPIGSRDEKQEAVRAVKTSTVFADATAGHVVLYRMMNNYEPVSKLMSMRYRSKYLFGGEVSVLIEKLWDVFYDLRLDARKLIRLVEQQSERELTNDEHNEYLRLDDLMYDLNNDDYSQRIEKIRAELMSYLSKTTKIDMSFGETSG